MLRTKTRFFGSSPGSLKGARGPLALAVLTQGIALASQFALVLVIARVWGPVGQGAFGVVKSWHDFMIGMLQLGLPQGFVYAINKGILGYKYLLRCSAALAGAALIVAMLANIGGVASGFIPSALPPYFSAILLAIAVAAGTYFSLIRGIYLTHDARVRFSALTITPAAALVIAVALSLNQPVPHFVAMFAVAGATSALAAGLAARSLSRLSRTEPPLDRAAWRVVLSHSANAFSQNLLLAVQPLLTFAIMRLAGAGLQTLGYFNLSLIPVIAVNALIAMIAPILYNHWSRTLGRRELPRLLLDFMLVAVGLGGLCIAAIFSTVPLLPAVVGHEFAPVGLPLRLMALIAPPLIFTRLCLPALLAVGLPNLATRIGVHRLLFLSLILGLTALLGADLLVGACFAWVGAEWLAAAILFRTAVRAGRSSSSESGGPVDPSEGFALRDANG